MHGQQNIKTGNMSVCYLVLAPEALEILFGRVWTGRPPTGVMIPDDVQYNFDLLTINTCARKM